MFLRLLLLCAFIVLLLPLTPQPALAQGNCDQFNFVPSRLQPGSTARVIYNNDGIGVVFRDNPGKEQSGSQVIRALPEGSILSILRGPVCVDGNIWWEVELSTLEQGWVAEGNATDYFIEPYSVSVFVFEPDATNPRQLHRWRIDANGNIQSRDTLQVPGADAIAAREIWQEPDLVAANEALASRRITCPDVLAGTPWENIPDAGSALVPEGSYEYYPSPDGSRVFLLRHRTIRMPGCNNGGGEVFGISTAHLLTTRDIVDLFPFGQHNGARSQENCMSPTVSRASWSTNISQVAWSPDSDTVAFTARYLDEDTANRPCAYYYTFMLDIFSGQVTSIAEGRRIGWGEGGTRLYYFTQSTDSGYNVLDTDFQQLSNGQTTSIGFPEGAQPLPGTLDSTGVLLPWTADGRQMLMCNGPINCPSVFSFDILSRQPSTAVPLPEAFEPFQVREVHFVAGDIRLLWLTDDGQAYIQALQGIDASNWGRVPVENLGADVRVDKLWVMPGGLFTVLKLTNGEFALLNTVNREIQVLGPLQERTTDPVEETDETVETDETEDSETEATPETTPES